jgi:hypothetical protein
MSALVRRMYFKKSSLLRNKKKRGAALARLEHCTDSSSLKSVREYRDGLLEWHFSRGFWA